MPSVIVNKLLPKTPEYFATRILNTCQKHQCLSQEFHTRHKEINEKLSQHLTELDNILDCQQFLLDIFCEANEQNQDPKIGDTLKNWLENKFADHKIEITFSDNELQRFFLGYDLNNPGSILTSCANPSIPKPSELSLFIVNAGADGKFVLQPIDSPLRSDSSQLTDSKMLASFENPQQLKKAIQEGVVVLAVVDSRTPTPPGLDQATAVSQQPLGAFIVDQPAIMIVNIGGNLISYPIIMRTTSVDGQNSYNLAVPRELAQQMVLSIPSGVVSGAQSSQSSEQRSGR